MARGQGLRCALRRSPIPAAAADTAVASVEPTYHWVRTTLTHPAYAGAYVYASTRKERFTSDPGGALRQRSRSYYRDQCDLLSPDHHPGFIVDTYQANQARIGTNIRPQAREPGTGAVRKGCALLQGLATCGKCGRKLAIFYTGPAESVPNYYCQGSAELVDRARRPGRQAPAGRPSTPPSPPRFLAALAPAALGCLPAEPPAARRRPRRRPGPATSARSSQARYQRGAGRAPLPGRGPGQPASRPQPGNRMGTRSPGTGGRRCRAGPAAGYHPKTLTDGERARNLALGDDLGQVWNAHHHRLRRRAGLAPTLIDEVNITLHRDDPGPHASPGLQMEERRDQPQA